MSAATPTTMQGMTWNANNILDKALDPDSKGVPKKLFWHCKGIVLFSVFEAGLIFSGTTGAGIVMVKKESGEWSAPCAISLTGMGFGLVGGAQVREVMVLIMDERTLASFTAAGQVKYGGKAALTVGPVGRELDVAGNISSKGVGGGVAYNFTQGLFGGAAFDGAVIMARTGENKLFYKKELSPQEILYGDAAEIPEDSDIPELHRKLALLAEGKTSKQTMEEIAEKEKMREEADQSAKEMKQSQADVVEAKPATESQ